MRRFAIAALAGLTLMAGQAVAANQSGELQVADRVGATKGALSNFRQANGEAIVVDGLTIGYWVVIAGVAAFAVYFVTQDSSDSP